MAESIRGLELKTVREALAKGALHGIVVRVAGVGGHVIAAYCVADERNS